MKYLACLPSRTALLLCGALLAGCQAPLGQLQRLADEHGRQIESLTSAPFILTSSVPAIRPGQRLRVYLEGDGHAWATRSQPSLDPSPRNLLVARLALADPQPSLYLARPCQFQQTAACHTELWTSRRYGPEVVDSLDQALDLLKTRHGNQEFELIGYSGGATLALLLAARREDITQVQTLAGNLSPRQWTKMLDLTPLQGSLEPLEQRQRLTQIAQRHLLGSTDRVIPAALLEHYRTTRGPARCLETQLLPGVGHAEGWEQAWALWRQRPLNCSP